MFLSPTASDSVASELVRVALMTQGLVTVWTHPERDFMKQEHL